MMDVRAAIGARMSGEPNRAIVYGQVSMERPAPTSFSSPLFVLVPSHSSEVVLEFASWPACNGATLPAQGADVVVGWDERGVAHVLSWTGVHS